MERINDIPSGLKKSSIECIEIWVWEIYLLKSRNNLANLLTTYSLDKRPLLAQSLTEGRTSFRFAIYDWEKTIVQILGDNYIPYEVIGNSLVDRDPVPIPKKKVYVAEDDLNILFALNTMLEEAGYDVLLSHCSEPMMQPKLPATDVFILDKRMPGVDGIEICRHLRKQNETKHVPVIMISASRNAATEAYAAGVNDFLEKPFKMDDLLKLVAKHTLVSARD